jgi:adenosylhomocysteine nucleosidase
VTGIICPIPTEAAPFLGAVSRAAKTNAAKQTLHVGIINHAQVVLVCCGVCKVNAAVAAQTLIAAHHVSRVIVSGTAGGIDPRCGVGDTVVSTEVAYHDVAQRNLTDFPPFMPTPLFKADEAMLALCKALTHENTVHYGRIVTGEGFIEKEGREAIVKHFAPLCVDMETAAVAHVCFMHDVPFLAVRSISDTEAESGVEAFQKNAALASQRSFDLTNKLLGAWA